VAEQLGLPKLTEGIGADEGVMGGFATELWNGQSARMRLELFDEAWMGS
jgi:hypothetical protein